jgi:protein involved in polysaccharide export with SLBB domain
MKSSKGSLRSCGFLITALLCITMVGCISLMPSPFRPSPGPKKTPRDYDLAQAFDIVCRNYRLGPGDTLRVLFQTEWSIPAGTYALDTLDEIEVEFMLDPALNRKLVIRPDGMITLPGIGEVKAAGRTPQQLAEYVEDKYRDAEIFGKQDAKLLKQYKLVTVNVSSFYQKVKKLVESLTTLTGGSQLSVIVNPDGTIDLPLLEQRIQAVGSTVREVESLVNKLYKAGPLQHVVASLALQTANSRKVYVMGEVARPGAYDITQPITALHAIALAGGHNARTADLTSVILISKDIYGKPIGRRLDLKKILDVGDMGSAILVKPYDVLFVPNTYVADLRIFMEQYILTIADFANLRNLLNGGT